MDKINIEILDDGTISIKTDEISAEKHLSADEFIRMLNNLAGGEVRKTPIKKGYSFSLQRKDRQVKTFQK